MYVMTQLYHPLVCEVKGQYMGMEGQRVSSPCERGQGSIHGVEGQRVSVPCVRSGVNSWGGRPMCVIPLLFLFII